MVLATVALVWRVDLFEGGGAGAGVAGRSCPIDEAPALAAAGPARLAGFERDLEGMIASREARFPEEKGLIPYEQGLVTEVAVWTDMEPGHGGVPASGRHPAGFEMRWWTAGGDDVGADVFLFENAAAAKRYRDLAISTECRSNASHRPALFPPGAEDLEWSNPFTYAQEDALLQRGPRVYRVVVVQPGNGNPTVGASTRLRGFNLVNELACALPGAGCGGDEPSTSS